MKHLMMIALLIIISTSQIFSTIVAADNHAIPEETSYDRRNASQLRIAYDPDLIPLNTFENEEESGFAFELMDRIAELSNIDVIYLPMTKSEAVDQIDNQEIDIILSIPFSEKHSNIMEFTDPYFSTSIGILTRVEDSQVDVMTDLSESLVALQTETVEYEFLKNIRRIQYQVASSQRRAFDIFIEGRADAYHTTGSTSILRRGWDIRGGSDENWFYIYEACDRRFYRPLPFCI